MTYRRGVRENGREVTRAELHVWAGGFHGFEGLAPDAKVTEALLHARDDWMMRMLS